MRTAVRNLAVLSLCVIAGCTSSRPYTAESIIEAQREYNARNAPTPTAASASTAADAAPTAAPEPGKPVEQVYRAWNSPHWIGSVLAAGGKLTLEDGSVWEVAPGDTFKTKFWRPSSKIAVTRGGNGQYPFRVSNNDKGEAVDARLISL